MKRLPETEKLQFVGQGAVARVEERFGKAAADGLAEVLAKLRAIHAEANAALVRDADLSDAGNAKRRVSGLSAALAKLAAFEAKEIVGLHTREEGIIAGLLKGETPAPPSDPAARASIGWPVQRRQTRSPRRRSR